MRVIHGFVILLATDMALGQQPVIEMVHNAASTTAATAKGCVCVLVLAILGIPKIALTFVARLSARLNCQGTPSVLSWKKPRPVNQIASPKSLTGSRLLCGVFKLRLPSAWIL